MPTSYIFQLRQRIFKYSGIQCISLTPDKMTIIIWPSSSVACFCSVAAFDVSFGDRLRNCSRPRSNTTITLFSSVKHSGIVTCGAQISKSNIQRLPFTWHTKYCYQHTKSITKNSLLAKFKTNVVITNTVRHIWPWSLYPALHQWCASVHLVYVSSETHTDSAQWLQLHVTILILRDIPAKVNNHCSSFTAIYSTAYLHLQITCLESRNLQISADI